MFPQEHRAGEYGQSDFTSMNDLGITIGGERFDHLLYHFVLPYSRWETGMVCFSESFETRIEDFRRERVMVTRFSTIRAAENTYSVSSRLIGEMVDLRLYAETIEVWHGERLMATMERQRGRGNVAIDYRHVIWSLVRKPG